MVGAYPLRIRSLADAKAFSGMSEHTLMRLAPSTTSSFVERGNFVFCCGSTATGVHVVVSGEVKLVIGSQRGTGHVVELKLAGDCFGEAAALTGRPHKTAAVAVTDCRLLHVARHALIDEMARDHALALCLIRNVCDRLYRRTGDLENVLFRNANGRVAVFILEQLDRQEKKSGSRIRLPSRKGLIASHLHMTQEHFSRTLHDMSARGLIRVLGLNVDIIEEASLRKLAV
jgi:CRP/FNR family transcriptional regulator, dissimilatory nitrate respiration regulator